MMVVCVILWLELGLTDFKHERPVGSLRVCVCLCVVCGLVGGRRRCDGSLCQFVA